MAYPTDYQIARGPEGLHQVLTNLFTQSRRAANSPSAQSQYVLYQLGQQEALLRFDLSHPLPQCWHYDLQGRPAAQGLINVIAKSFWEQLDPQKPAFESWRDQVFRTEQFNDVSRAEAHRAQAAFLSGQGDWVVAVEIDHTLAHAKDLLEKAAQQKAQANLVSHSESKMESSQGSHEQVKSMISFGLFRKKAKQLLKPNQEKSQDLTNNKKGPGVR